MSSQPGVMHGRMGRDDLMREGKGSHIEIAQSDSEMTAFDGVAHEFRNFPRLRGAVTEIRIARLLFVGGM